jgi:hypothetical protein
MRGSIRVDWEWCGEKLVIRVKAPKGVSLRYEANEETANAWVDFLQEEAL